MDWRLKVDAPILGYTGILAPLAATGGVIFPYTPTVQVTYSAQYDATPLTHSNYKVHMYSASSVENIQVTGDFTAQDGDEASYMLAVIHFFKSVTKMYYGRGGTAPLGTPPPLCYMSGFGEYHFNKSPMAVTSFNLSLPNDCDYIPTGTGQGGIMDSARAGAAAGEGIAGTAGAVIGAIGGAVLAVGGYSVAPSFANKSSGTTMVPTKIQITFSAIPIISRMKVSNEFSLDEYKTGSLLGKGFW